VSLITDALQKAQSHSPVDRPAGPPATPPWWSAGLVLGALALLWWWAAHTTPHGAAPGVARPTPAARPVAAKVRHSEPLTPILSLLPATPASPSLNWRIDGVVTGMGAPLVIINGKTVAEGESLSGGTKVVSVSQEQVELQRENGETVTVPVESSR